MDNKEIETLIENYLRNNLVINTKEIGGTYGSPAYIEIELELNGKVISSAYIDK